MLHIFGDYPPRLLWLWKLGSEVRGLLTITSVLGQEVTGQWGWGPITVQYSGHVTCAGQSEHSILRTSGDALAVQRLSRWRRSFSSISELLPLRRSGFHGGEVPWFTNQCCVFQSDNCDSVKFHAAIWMPNHKNRIHLIYLSSRISWGWHDSLLVVNKDSIIILCTVSFFSPAVSFFPFQSIDWLIRLVKNRTN